MDKPTDQDKELNEVAGVKNSLVPPEGAGINQTLAEYYNRSRTAPIINKCFMQGEHLDEVMDVILCAVEKYPWANARISEEIKNNLDLRMGTSWHVVVGEAFSMDIEFESRQMLFLFYGSLGIAVWKCGTLLMADLIQKRKNRRR